MIEGPIETTLIDTLYQQNSRGKNKFWTILVTEYNTGAASYTMQWGQVDGKVQESTTFIREGKNLGKSNATTPYEQALSEAKSKVEKQIDKGYVHGVPKPKSEAVGVDIRPMLAHKYEDYAHKVQFPVFAQPKLDGCRALAVFDENGFVDLISRQGKSFGQPMEHIIEALSAMNLKNVVLDGELYNHDLEFQTVVSYIKKLRPESKLIQYHVYDCILNNNEAFSERNKFLIKNVKETSDIKLVSTHTINDEDELSNSHDEFVSGGYEGLMLRNGDCSYKIGLRSYDLLKVKAFQEQEFEIVGAVEGVGRAAGQATFICKTDMGDTFNCRPKGTDEERQNFWLDRNSYRGKMLTVRFFEWTTGENPVPRFPVGIVRDYE
jgi:DNA ligase-1